jgi:hypothetical protein
MEIPRHCNFLLPLESTVKMLDGSAIVILQKHCAGFVLEPVQGGICEEAAAIDDAHKVNGD